MKKINRVISGSIAFVFGLGIVSNVTKTDFQKNLEKTIKVSVKNQDVQPFCIKVCGNKSPQK